jgi:hypothetical protein
MIFKPSLAEVLDLPILLHPGKPMTIEQVKGYERTNTLGNLFENTIAIARIIALGRLDKHPKPAKVRRFVARK